MQINKIINDLLKRKTILIVLAAFLLTGLIVGVFFNTFAEKFFSTKNVVDYYVNALSKRGNVSSLLISGFLTNLLCLGLFLLCSYITPLIAVDCIVLFYRGYIVGQVAGIFLSHFGVSGFFVYFLTVLLPGLIASLTLIVFVTLQFSIKDKKCNSDKKRNYLILASIGVFAATIVQAVFLLLFLRPMNFNF